MDTIPNKNENIIQKINSKKILMGTIILGGVSVITYYMWNKYYNLDCNVDDNEIDVVEKCICNN